MDKKKNSLIDKDIGQRKNIKLLLCFTITFFILGSASFYTVGYGQNLNSSNLNDSTTNTVKNLNTSQTNASNLGFGKDFSSSLPDLFNYVQRSVVQITDP